MAASTGTCDAMLSDKNSRRPDADGGDVNDVKYNGKKGEGAVASKIECETRMYLVCSHLCC